MENKRAALYELRTKEIDKDRFAIEALVHPNASVLEVGCGTGRILAWLAQRNHSQIIGIEIREDFLEIAQKKLNRAENVQLVNVDFLKYQPETSTDFILFAFNVFGEFESRDKRIEVLRHAKSLLNTNGWIIIIYDLPKQENPDQEFVEYNFKIGNNENVWDVSLACSRDFETQVSTCNVVYKNTSGEIIYDSYKLSSITREELLDTYTAAGLFLKKEYGSYELSSWQQDSQVLIHVIG